MLQASWRQRERQRTGRGSGAYKGLGCWLQQGHKGCGRAQLHQVPQAAHDLEGGAAVQAGGDLVLQITMQASKDNSSRMVCSASRNCNGLTQDYEQCCLAGFVLPRLQGRANVLCSGEESADLSAAVACEFRLLLTTAVQDLMGRCSP